MIFRAVLLLIALFGSLVSLGVAEDRFGLLGITDGVFSRAQQPYSPEGVSPAESTLNGQLVLLGTLKVSRDLSAFYEGRLNHTEGFDGSEPRLQQTRVRSVVQGYLRYSPQLSWDINFQVGKFGTPFGHFLTRNYSNQNPLIAAPLIYSHRTSILSDRIPQNAAYVSDYQSGKPDSANRWSYGSGTGLPLLGFSYPTGVMAFGSSNKVDYRFALVNSSLSNPLDLGEPGQRPQWVAAAGLTCFPSLRLGSSYAAGPYLSGSVKPFLPAGSLLSDFKQRALGFDLEYSFHHLQAYAELLFSSFNVPNIRQRLGATGYFLELTQTWTPRFFSAVRWNQIYFDRFRSGYLEGSRFDNNVTSIEIGLGYHLTEKLLAKTSYQYQRILAADAPRPNIFAAQLVYRFDLLNLLRVQ